MDEGRSSEERLRQVLLGAKAGTWQVRLDPFSVHWDEGGRDFYGFPFDKEPSNTAWEARLHPEDLPRVSAQVQQGLSDRIPA